ncbi:MAG: AAA family ATPase [Firmicutes bacterium]|nr:AAA family ATPase [Bacillota bacterium]
MPNSNITQNAAISYCRRGWSVIPLRPKDKKPAIPSWEPYQKRRATEEQVRHWWQGDSSFNIGIVTGAVSGICVLDIDGPQGREAVKGLALPPTPTVETGKGWHCYFKHPGGPVQNAVGLLPHVDLRGDGGYVAAPPSIHPSGRQYRWCDGLSPDDVELAPPPQWVLDKLEARPKVAKAVLNEPIPEGQRNATLTSIAGSLRRRGADEGAILAALKAVNQERCKPPLPEEELANIAKSVGRYPARGQGAKQGPQVGPPPSISAVDLMKKEFPDPVWVIPELLPEGLTLLGGKPKMGKSWLALGIALAVACGGRVLGKIAVEKHDAIYLALEDTPRRLKDRIGQLLQGDQAPAGLHLVTECPRVDKGGLVAIEALLVQHPDVRLVIIDVLKRLRPPQRGNQNLYDQDYEILANLKAIADRRGVAMLIVHHLKKLAEDDPLDMLSGTTGLAGAADGIWILKRDRARADGVLFVTGRDIEEKEFALERDPHIGGWVFLGDAEKYRMSQERQEIIEVLQNSGEAMSPKEIAEILERPHGAVKKLLYIMSKDGEVRLITRGRYIHNSNHSNFDNMVSSVSAVTLESKAEESYRKVTEGYREGYRKIEAESLGPQASPAKVTEVTVVSRAVPDREVFDI